MSTDIEDGVHGDGASPVHRLRAFVRKSGPMTVNQLTHGSPLIHPLAVVSGVLGRRPPVPSGSGDICCKLSRWRTPPVRGLNTYPATPERHSTASST